MKFCEGPNNGGPSLAKFHEGPDPRTLAGSTPMGICIGVGVRSKAPRKRPDQEAECVEGTEMGRERPSPQPTRSFGNVVEFWCVLNVAERL